MAETLEHVGKKWTLGISGKKALRQKEATNNSTTQDSSLKERRQASSARATWDV